MSGAHWRCRNWKRESEGWSLKLPSALISLPTHGRESFSNRAAVAAAAHSVLRHLEDYRNGNKKGRATVGRTELEGITSEAPRCCVIPEKDDRHL